MILPEGELRAVIRDAIRVYESERPSIQSPKVTMEQIRKGAIAAQNHYSSKHHDIPYWHDLPTDIQRDTIMCQIIAFRAAGFEVEE